MNINEKIAALEAEIEKLREENVQSFIKINGVPMKIKKRVSIRNEKYNYKDGKKYAGCKSVPVFIVSEK